MCVSSVFVFYPGFFCNLREVIRLIVGGCAATNINYMSCCLKHSDKIRPNDRGNHTQATNRECIINMFLVLHRHHMENAEMEKEVRYGCMGSCMLTKTGLY